MGGISDEEINNNSDGSVIKNTKSTTGKIYVTYANFSGTASLSYSFVDGNFSGLSGGSVTLSKTSGISSENTINITGGSSPSLAAATTGCYILWTLSYTDAKDSIAKKAYALTYVYKPYVVPVGTFVRARCDYGTDSYAQQVTWIAGMHSIVPQGSTKTHDGNYYPNYKGSFGLSAFLTDGNKAYAGGTEVTAAGTTSTQNSTWSANYTGASRMNLAFLNYDGAVNFNDTKDHNDEGATSWGNSSGNTFDVLSFDYWYKNSDSGDRNSQAYVYATPYGVISVDTSRFTDLKNIPNLGIGLMATDNQHTDTGNWYVADYTTTTTFTSPKMAYNASYSQSGASNRDTYFYDYGYIIARMGANKWDDWNNSSEGVKYAGAWPRALLNTSSSFVAQTYAMKGMFATNDGNDYAFAGGIVRLDANQYNKSSLRAAVQNALKKFPALGVNGISSGITSCYFDADNNYKWQTFVNAYAEAYQALTKVDGTITNPDTLATKLNNALAALCTRVDYDYNGGTVTGVSNPSYVTIGANQTATVTPGGTGTKYGYDFKGWNLDKNATTGSTSVTVGYNNTVYAIWQPKSYSISYTLNGGTVSGNPTSYTIETSPVRLNNPTKTGYTFTGWTGSNGSTPQTDVTVPNGVSSGLSQYTTSSPYTAGVRDHILGNAFAVQSGAAYRVFVTAKRVSGTLNMQGGIWYSSYTEGAPYDGYSGAFSYFRDAGNGWAVYYKDVTVPAGKQAGRFYIQLDQRAETGFTTSWQIADCSVTKFSLANISYTANWTPNGYTVHFNGNGATGGSMSDQSFVYDTAQALKSNAFTRSYTVTYNYNGNGSANTTATATATFNGWEDRGAIVIGGTTYDYTTYDAPYYANTYVDLMNAFGYNKYNLINHYINYGRSEGRSIKGSTPGLYPNGASVNNMTTTANYTVPLYANWTLASVTLPTATRTGYTFAGWYDAATGGNLIGNAGAAYTPTANKTLFAHWTPISYTVTYNGNGATGGATASSSHTYDVAKNLTANGFNRIHTVTYNYNYTGSTDGSATATATFNGWATSDSGAKVYNNSQSVINLTATNGATVPLFANWTLASVTLPAATRTGYRFDGWYDAATGGTKIGNAGAAYTPTANKTLYAHWVKQYYIDLNGWINGQASGSLKDLDTDTFSWGTADVYVNGVCVANDVIDFYQAYDEGTAYEIKDIKGTPGYDYVGPHSDVGTWNSDPITGTLHDVGRGNVGAFVVLEFAKIVKNDVYVLDFGLGAKLNVLANDISGATLSAVPAGTADYSLAKEDSQISFIPLKPMSEPIVFDYTVTYKGSAYTATATVIPANNVYYEDSFFDFTDESGVAWKQDGTTGSAVQAAVEAAQDDSVDLYGSDAAYATSTTYSLGSAMYAEVSPANKTASKATFTFTGTGFDLYAVTSGATGLTTVIIEKLENGASTTVAQNLVNTYYGYNYGRLYLKDGKVSLDSSGTPIYYAPAGKTDGTFFIRGTVRGQTAKSYYASEKVVKDGAGTEATAAYAYGWVAGAPAAGSPAGIYQVPVISKTGLAYGTYRVTVQPKYSSRQDLTGNGKYRFYIDSVRVYDPLDPDSLGAAATAAYQGDNEYGAQFVELRDQLITAPKTPNLTGGSLDGIAFLENKESDTGKTALQSYAEVGPKNEIYLAAGQAIAFTLTTSDGNKPAKLSLGMKLLSGGTGEVKVTGSKGVESSVTCTLNNVTDLYRDISAAVNWSATGSSTFTAGTVTIANTGNTAVSLTKLKWSYGAPAATTQAAFAPKMLRFSVSQADLDFAGAAFDAINTEQTTASSEGVTVTWDNETLEIGGTATLTITAPATFEKAFKDGNESPGHL